MSSAFAVQALKLLREWLSSRLCATIAAVNRKKWRFFGLTVEACQAGFECCFDAPPELECRQLLVRPADLAPIDGEAQKAALAIGNNGGIGVLSPTATRR